MLKLSTSQFISIGLVATCALLAGCGAQGDSEPTALSESALDGDWEGGTPPQPEDELGMETPKTMTAEAPCGENTVAQVTAANGNVITFCALNDRTAVVTEMGEIGNAEYTTSRDAQSLSVAGLYSLVAGPEAAIPAKLVELSDTPMRRLGDVEPAASGFASAQEAEPAVSDVASTQQAMLYKPQYCSSAATFANEKCWRDYDANFCGNGYITASIRTCSAYFSGITPCLAGWYSIAACGTGSTRQELLWRDTTNRSWRSSYSIDVPSQYYNSAVVFTSDLAGDDFRFKGTALSSGGWFRYYAGFDED